MLQRFLRIVMPIVLLLPVSLAARSIEVPVAVVNIIVPPSGEDLSLGPRLCLKFNMPEGIAGVELGHAGLQMRLRLAADSPDSIVLFEAMGLLSSWNPGGGWNDFPVPGGDIDSSHYTVGSFKCETDSVVSLDITPLAQEWNDGGANFGLIIIPRRSDSNALRLFRYSSDELRNLIALKVLVPGREE